MRKYWESLRPFEKRVLVIGGIFLLVVLHFVVVQPRISEWDAVQDRKFQGERKLKMFLGEIAKKSSYQKQIKELEGQSSQSVAQEDQANAFANAIQAQAIQSNVHITQNSHTSYNTNLFFVDLSQTLNIESGESNLVDFLYNLGSGSSLIRVQDLGLRPNPPHQQLVANVKVVASYQMKAPAKSPASGASRAAAAKSDVTTASSSTSTAK